MSTRYLSNREALSRGYSSDRRKRRAQHRQSAKTLRSQGGGGPLTLLMVRPVMYPPTMAHVVSM